MLINDAQVQNNAATGRSSGRYPPGLPGGAEINTSVSGRTKAERPLTMETVIERANMMLAYQRVVENKGAAGVDNLSVTELEPWLNTLGDTQNGYPETGRWRENMGYPNGGRPAYPTSDSTTVNSSRGIHILQLRL
ncbi:putative Retron-type reverse transcriptase-like [Xenorhabdus nematophila ATCC 19061]|uniref:Retron-type reverse transcriptase-like n=1 Tax=Xenorhabdus nematophila (strain ATCC 19061 / DSM 3370 / CCUG 14189 / LMG 1036 / NCIMB 9965 / AN6) TaxID=406817 RepID=D3VHP1_XENNA|nr:putative Retron-type reverse transcriptase-like [Xenorhabdus nematophila ATCC 19061]CEK21299.1 putative Retron-type reverse transcriptase-like [Xenorhabdus nematophila AN6/1]